MKKKLIAAVAAITFGFSLNVSADYEAGKCQRICGAAANACAPDNYRAGLCEQLLAGCEDCLAGQ